MRNLLSITIICLSFLIIGTFLSLSNNLQFTAKQISENMVLIFFLKDDISDDEINSITEEFKKNPSITKTTFISTELALEKFMAKFPDLRGIVDNLDVNPFPPSFELTFEEKSLSSPETNTLIERIKNFEGVEDVQFNKDWVEKMNSLSRLVQAIGYFLGGILVLASFFIISNIVKLNVFARKDEIQILRLVGATNNFIKIPFLLEGVFMGIAGGLLSLFFLLLLIEIFPVYLGSSLGVLNEFINFRYLTLSQSLIMILFGACIGLFGSLTSLSRFLKV
jgi:cell division transport system permease protein